jgi:N-acetyl-anhydromuramyl-L-alanine amidase AmpD
MNKQEILKYLKSYRVTRKITDIVIHCSATKPGVKADVETIDRWHKDRGFSKQKESGHYCGYHFVIAANGNIEKGRTLNEIGAHVSGSNAKSVGICYAGGLDASGKAKDTRTKEQKDALVWLLFELAVIFPDAKIKGHRDYSPDRNGDGIIENWEWLKDCPCFNAAKEYENI